jgi:hypothetical protein
MIDEQQDVTDKIPEIQLEDLPGGGPDQEPEPEADLTAPDKEGVQVEEVVPSHLEVEELAPRAPIPAYPAYPVGDPRHPLYVDPASAAGPAGDPITEHRGGQPGQPGYHGHGGPIERESASLAGRNAGGSRIPPPLPISPGRLRRAAPPSHNAGQTTQQAATASDRPARPLEDVLATTQTQHNRLCVETDRLMQIVAASLGDSAVASEVPRSETRTPVGSGDIANIQMGQDDVNYQLDVLETLVSTLAGVFT